MALSQNDKRCRATALAGVTLGDAGLARLGHRLGRRPAVHARERRQAQAAALAPLRESERDGFKRMADAFTATTGVPVEIPPRRIFQVSIKPPWPPGMGGDLISSGRATPTHISIPKAGRPRRPHRAFDRKLGGWYPIAVDYGIHDGTWVCLPVGSAATT